MRLRRKRPAENLSRKRICYRDRRPQRLRGTLSAQHRMKLCHHLDHEIPYSRCDRKKTFAPDVSGLSAKKPTSLPRSPMRISAQQQTESAGRISDKARRPRKGQIALTKAKQLTDGFAIAEPGSV